jgi:hypothetical protein
MKREPFESFHANLRSRIALRGSRVRELAEQGKALYDFPAKTGRVAVHASTRKPGTWQVTAFLPDGRPSGHLEAPTRAAALRLAHDMTADLGQPSSTNSARRFARKTSRVPLLVTPEGERPRKTTLEEFLIDNEGSPSVCEAVRMLGAGEAVTLGGGAAPYMTVKRLPMLKKRKRG